MKDKVVRFDLDHDDPPKLSDARRAALKELSERPDTAIDCSDIPQLTETFWENAIRNPFYKPVKTSTTVRIDSDVLYWLKLDGPGYQSRINAILRREMLAAHKVLGK